MGVLLLIIPLYLIIAWEWVPGRSLHAPSTALDEWMPLVPAWSLVYGSLFLAAFLPVFVLHHRELLDRTIIAYLVCWLVAYAFFIGYPTVCPRPQGVEGEGFSVWALRAIYASDPRYNCFPSLHVAQCFVAALACGRVHAALGRWLLAWATLVALSTLLTKQHYVLDAVAGALLASAAWWLTLRKFPRESVPAKQRLLAPRLAGAAFAAYGLLLAGFWLLFIT